MTMEGTTMTITIRMMSQEAQVELIREHVSRRPMVDDIILVPERGIGDTLVRRLAGVEVGDDGPPRGIMGPRVLTPMSFARELAEAAGIPLGEPMSRVDDMTTLARVCPDLPAGGRGEVADTISLLKRNGDRDLEDLGSLLSDIAPYMKELVASDLDRLGRYLHAYEEGRGGRMGRNDILVEASEVARGFTGELILTGFHRMDPVLGDLVRVIGLEGNVTLLVEPFLDITSFRVSGDVIIGDPGDGAIRTNDGDVTPQLMMARDVTSVRSVRVADRDGQYEDLARRVLQDVEDGHDLDSMLVVARNVERHERGLRRCFGRHGIPLLLEHMVHLPTLSASAFLDLVMRWWSGGFSGQVRRDLGSHIPMADGHRAVKGETGEDGLLDLPDDDEAVSRTIRECERRFAETRSGPVDGNVVSAVLMETVRGLMTHRTDAHHREVIEGMRLLWEMLKRLPDTAHRMGWDGPVPLPEWVDRLVTMTSLESAPARMPATRGLKVVSPRSTLFRKVRTCHVLGLNEGEFPARMRDPIFLKTEVREALNRTGRDYPTPVSTSILERSLFHRLMSLPAERFVLYTVDLGGPTTPLLPSRFLEEMEGYTLPDGSSIPLDTRERRRLADMIPLQDSGISPVMQLERECSRDGTSDGRIAECRRRALETIHSPSIDGAVVDPRLLRGSLGLERTFSVTALNILGRCQYRFLVEHLINSHEDSRDFDPRIRGSFYHAFLEDMMQDWRRLLDQYGPMVGSIIDRFDLMQGVYRGIEESKDVELNLELMEKAKEIQDSAIALREELAGRLGADPMFQETFDASFRRFSHWSMGPGSRMFQRIRGRDLLARFVASELVHIEQSECRPRVYEGRFGSENGPGELKVGSEEYPEEAVSVRGTIDRVDISERTDNDGWKGALVVDYKTGSIPKGSSIKSYRELQGLLYLLEITDYLKDRMGDEPVRPLGFEYVSMKDCSREGVYLHDPGFGPWKDPSPLPEGGKRPRVAMDPFTYHPNPEKTRIDNSRTMTKSTYGPDEFLKFLSRGRDHVVGSVMSVRTGRFTIPNQRSVCQYCTAMSFCGKSAKGGST